MSSTSKNIIYANKGVLPDVPFNPRDVKIRISIMVDGDVLQAYKEKAEHLHTKYQSLMHQKLREGITGTSEQSAMKSEVLKDLLNRVSSLEKKIKAPARRRGKKSRSKKKAA